MLRVASIALLVFALDKADFLLWSRKYDKAFGWQAQRERELGAKFRKNKVMTKADLSAIADWKFKDEPDRKARTLELVERNSEETVNRVSSQVFNLPNGDDVYRMNCLTTLEGISPVIASVILAFFDPKIYGIFDVRVWKQLLGNPPAGLLTVANYRAFLLAIRKTAGKHNLDVRVVDKALFKKSLDDSGLKK
jgi:hypothetical protein